MQRGRQTVSKQDIHKADREKEGDPDTDLRRVTETSYQIHSFKVEEDAGWRAIKILFVNVNTEGREVFTGV